MGCLENRVILVTGGGRGVGRAEALACAAEGARVVVNDLGCDVHGEGQDPRVAADVAEEIAAAGGRAVADYENVTTPGAADRLVRRALDTYGRLDGLVYSAGVQRGRMMLKGDDADLEAVLDVQLRAAIRFTRVCARACIQGKSGGSLLLTAGSAAFFGAARQTIQGAAAGAVVGFARSAAVELARHNVRVNVLVPLARTRATEELPIFRGIREDSMTPEHVAPAAAYLMSPEAAEVTGEIVGVAGDRIYALRIREATGAFAPAEGFSPQRIHDAWTEITRL